MPDRRREALICGRIPAYPATAPSLRRKATAVRTCIRESINCLGDPGSSPEAAIRFLRRASLLERRASSRLADRSHRPTSTAFTARCCPPSTAGARRRAPRAPRSRARNVRGAEHAVGRKQTLLLPQVRRLLPASGCRPAPRCNQPLVEQAVVERLDLAEHALGREPLRDVGGGRGAQALAVRRRRAARPARVGRWASRAARSRRRAGSPAGRRGRLATTQQPAAAASSAALGSGSGCLLGTTITSAAP